jgi:hypothetical protein
MSTMTLEEMKNFFGMGILQDTLTVLHIAERSGIALTELKSFVEEQKGIAIQEAVMTSKVFKKLIRKCPVCNSELELVHIHEPLGKGNINGYKSLWSCSSDYCIHEEFNQASVGEIFNKLMRKER